MFFVLICMKQCDPSLLKSCWNVSHASRSTKCDAAWTQIREIFCYNPKLYSASFWFYATLSYCELASIAVTQLPQAVSLLSLICLTLFICPGLYLQCLTNPVICIQMLFSFMWCQKGNGLGLIKGAVWSCSSFNSGWQPTKHKPTWLFRSSRTEDIHTW